MMAPVSESSRGCKAAGTGRAEKLRAVLQRPQSERAGWRGNGCLADASPRSAPGALSVGLSDLAPSFAMRPRGTFESRAAPEQEVLRDFARIFLASERRLFVMARGMVSMRSLQQGSGASFPTPRVGASAGDLDANVLRNARKAFCEALTQRLGAAGAPALDEEALDRLGTHVATAMSASVGVDFALGAGLLPTLLQPLYVLVILDGCGLEPLQARMLVYGFVAGHMGHVTSNDPDSKCTPFCACLMSPDLLTGTEEHVASPSWTWEYSVRKVSTTTIREAAERDAQLLRDMVKMGRWADKWTSEDAPNVGKPPVALASSQITNAKEEAISDMKPSAAPSGIVACAPDNSHPPQKQLTHHSAGASAHAEPAMPLPAAAVQPPKTEGPVVESQVRPAASKPLLATRMGASPPAGTSFGSFMRQPFWMQGRDAHRRNDSDEASRAPPGVLRDLSPQLAVSSSGHFISTAAPLVDAARDFARTCLTNRRRVFVMARGMVSMRPLHLAARAGAGDSEIQTRTQAQDALSDAVGQWLEATGTAAGQETLHRLRDGAILAMSSSVGMDFSQHAGLLPMFLQPMFVLMVLGGFGEVPLRAHVLAYGFVAGKLEQMSGGHPESRSTSFVARLASPDLLAATVDGRRDWEWEYAVRKVRSSTIREAAERDAQRLREAVSLGAW